MIFSSKAKLLLAGTCVTTVVVLAGCGKATDKAVSPSATAPASTGGAAASSMSQEAPLWPDNSRTDPEAVAMRKRFFEWKAAKGKLAIEAARKLAAQANAAGNPASTGNYGRMTDGLPQTPADKN